MCESSDSSFELPDDNPPIDFDSSLEFVTFQFTSNDQPDDKPDGAGFADEYSASIGDLGNGRINPMAGAADYSGAETTEAAKPDVLSGLPPTIMPPTDHGEVSSGDEQPRLPQVEADLKWKVLHDGDVEIIGTKAVPNAEIIKIYRSSVDAPRTTWISTSSGTDILVNSSDIVMVYPTDEHGLVVGNVPSAVFQSNVGTQADGAPMALEEYLDLCDKPDVLPVIGRSNALVGPLQVISSIARALGLSDNAPYAYEIPSGNPHEVLIRYPILGSRTSVITPNGDLIDGRTGDIIEVAHVGPDQGYETLRLTSLSALGNKKGYIRIR